MEFHRLNYLHPIDYNIKQRAIQLTINFKLKKLTRARAIRGSRYAEMFHF